jgi:hypothetical protein
MFMAKAGKAYYMGKGMVAHSCQPTVGKAVVEMCTIFVIATAAKSTAD